MKLERHHVQFFTAVCNDWLRFLDSDEAKDIVIKALQYQVKIGHVKVAFSCCGSPDPQPNTDFRAG